MKKLSVLFLLVSFALQAEEASAVAVKNVAHAVEKKKGENASPLRLVDALKVVVYTDTDPILLTRSELDRLSINGGKQRPEDVILSRIMDYEAVHIYKIPVPEESVTKYIDSLKEQGLDEQQLKATFKNAGYSYEEGLDELRRMLSVDSLLNFKIKSRLVIPEDEIRQYYDKHKEVVPPSYKIKKGFLAKDALSESEREELYKTGKHSQAVEWLTPYWQAEDEFPESYAFIFSMKEGQIAKPTFVGSGYELLKLLKKKEGRTKSFEESYKDIAERLRMPMFEKMLSEYKKELLKKYEIVYL